MIKKENGSEPFKSPSPQRFKRTSYSRRKSGTWSLRKRRRYKIQRDQQIYQILQNTKHLSSALVGNSASVFDPLTVYINKPFPVTHQPNHFIMPQWEDLTPWLKCQSLVMRYSQHRLLTFTVHIHPDYLETLESKNANIKNWFRDRFRKQVAKVTGEQREWFFIVEAFSGGNRLKGVKRGPVDPHIHGAILLDDKDDEKAIRKAIHKAAGQGVNGNKITHKALGTELFHKEGPKYVNYLLKFIKIKDDRLANNRLAVSRLASQNGKRFWNLITGKEK